jgi:lipopolysaccharide transport system ATP-binding protein
MTEHAIEVVDVSKRYRIGELKRRYDTLRDRVVYGLKGLLKREPRTDADADTIWALKDVSFSVAQGEVLGIIGRNGAGKTTLLKILSRITIPTTGSAWVRGRVGSLLAVGTGFHPELTGRENVYLNGAVLGMTRAEINRKFDEIVDFSGVERFIDTPIKRYSSGMNMRLAFSVAAHLEPEILMVDEVLAVGDAAFNRKCVSKMKDVTAQGRTVLFVAHYMPAIESLCDNVIWMDEGTIVQRGPTKQVVAQYINKINQLIEPRKVGEFQNLGHRRGTGEIQFTEVRLINGSGTMTREFMLGDNFRMEAEFRVFRNVDRAVFSVSLVDASTQATITKWVGNQDAGGLHEGQRGRLIVELSTNVLRTRSYYVKLVINDGVSMKAFDVWDGVGTEFVVEYPEDFVPTDSWVADDTTLATLPMTANIERLQ